MRGDPRTRVLLGGNCLREGARGGEANVSKSLAEGLGRNYESKLLFSPVSLEIRSRWFLRWFFGDSVPWMTEYYGRAVRKFSPKVAILFGDLDGSMLQACLNSRVRTILALQSYWPICPKSSFWNQILERSCATVSPSARDCTSCVNRTLQEGGSTFLKSIFAASKGFGVFNNDLVRFNLGVMKRRIQSVDRVIVPSNYVRQVITKELKLPPEKVQVVYNGVDTSFFTPKSERRPSPKSKKTIVFSGVLAGGLSHLKGFTHFVRLAKLLSKKRSDVQFVAAGGVMPQVGPVSCVGYLSRHEMVRLYQESYLALVLSIWDEPFGLVVTEPMACGKPTIAYATGGIGEIIEHGSTGLLVTRGNLEGIADCIEYLLDDEIAAMKIGANARKRVEMLFSSASMVEKYQAKIEELAG